MRVIGFHGRLRTNHATLSYAKALKMTRRESIETTIRKRRFFLGGGVAQQSEERYPIQGMFGWMAGEENPRPGGRFKTWHSCIVKDLSREFRATEGSAEHYPLVFGVETALLSTAAKKRGKSYLGVFEAAERFMVKWHEDEAQLRRQRCASVVGSAQDIGGGERQHEEWKET